MTDFKAKHINATADDFLGNNGVGRYIFLPGSSGRTKKIAEHFDNVEVSPHSRGHDFYKGTLTRNGKTLDVGVVSSGMGAASAEIIMMEILQLGASRILRLGTAGYMQPYMKTGDIAVTTGSVRDEATTARHIPIEFPAVASFDIVRSIKAASDALGFNDRVHYGIFHSKNAFYAREFGMGPMKEKNKEYITWLQRAGVIASEMESSAVLTLASLADAELRQKTNNKKHILAGTICTLLGGEGEEFPSPDEQLKMEERLINLGIEAWFHL
jgi:uridine phosphorylase